MWFLRALLILSAIAFCCFTMVLPTRLGLYSLAIGCMLGIAWIALKRQKGDWL